MEKDDRRPDRGAPSARAGAQVTIAENGRLAVALARSQPFDLILMDMQMPEFDGYGQTQRTAQGAGAPSPSSP